MHGVGPQISEKEILLANLHVYSEKWWGRCWDLQRKLEITRALAMEPSVLLLDEPAAGMNPTETMELMQTIRTVKENFKISVLLIEHDMNFVMGICQRIFVLDYGKVIAVGTPEEIQNNPQVVAAYLGA